MCKGGQVPSPGLESPKTKPAIEKQVDANHHDHLDKRSSRPRSPELVPSKINGLTVLQGKVIPGREASRIAGHFMTVSRAMMRSTRFTPNEKIVITFLIDSLGPEHHHCWPGLKTIAAETGTPRRTVIDILNRLIAAKLLFKTAGGGSGISSRYYLSQALYPCRRHPETLCDRNACQEECSWKINSAVTALFSPEHPEAEQCGHRTLSDDNSAVTAPFTPRNSAATAPEEKKYGAEEKKEGKRSCPPAAGDPGPRPSLSVEMTEAEVTVPSIPESGHGQNAKQKSEVGVGSESGASGHHQIKDLFCRLYEKAFGQSYIWQAQDGAILKDVLKLDVSLDQVKAGVEAMFKDEWVKSRGLVNMKWFKSHFNQYLASSSSEPTASGPGSWDDTAIDVHTRPQPGEEPYPWPWPRTGQLRFDGDIPHKNRDRDMSEFSPDLVGRVHTWLANKNHDQGWVLTLAGSYGNGKSSFAGALLQAWRDHMTPEIDGLELDPRITGGRPDPRSHFLTYEAFKADSYVTDVNDATGWVGESRIDQEYIDHLATVKVLVIDDLCSGEMNKVQYDALQDLLRLREQLGHMTIITTNRTITEIASILGESVADRLRAGLILRFVDDSQRGQQVVRPQGVSRAVDRGRTMPNPEMDPEKANIPYVEPEVKKCSGVSIADQARAEAATGLTEAPQETNEDALAAAIVSLNEATASAEPVAAVSAGPNSPPPERHTCGLPATNRLPG